MKIAFLAVQLYFVFTSEAAPCSLFICTVDITSLAQSRFEINLLDPKTCQIVILSHASSYNNILLHPASVTPFYSQFRASRARFTNFKALIQVLTDWDIRNEFYLMILLQQTRTIFIQSCIDYVRQYDLDGISVKHSECKKPYFKDPFKLLLEEMMDAFLQESQRTGRKRILLYVQLSNRKYFINDDYDIPTIFRLADVVIINTMYYYWSLTEAWTHRHHSRIYGNNTSDELNMNYTVNFYLSNGAIKSKLVISIGFFGILYRSYLGIPFPKRYIRMKLEDHGQICKRLDEYRTHNGRVRRYPDTCPYYFFYDDRYLIYYDDAVSVRSKVKFAKEQGLAGVSIWDVSQDDMTGECGEGRFPLLQHVINECSVP